MSFALELALDRLDAELAAELPAHLRAFADAYARGEPPPPAPAALGRGSLDLARRALLDPSLAPRARAVLRLLSPIAIEDDPAVVAARARAPAWEHYPALRAARDAAARAAVGRDHLAWIGWLHGASRAEAEPVVDVPPPPAGWHAPAAARSVADVERAWRVLAARHGVTGRCRIVEAAARPRTVIVEPGREVVVITGAPATPAQAFAALHELGHAVAALLSPVALPRALDEAAAAYVARLLEHPDGVPGWYAPVAAPARQRRRALVGYLAAIEAGRVAADPAIVARPPWAVWHDPDTQACYLAAEQHADRWWAATGAEPAPGWFAGELARAVAALEREALG